MSKPQRSDPPEDRVLWDVVEEHLAESEFLLEQIDRAFDSPTLTLRDLEQGLEARLAAHLHGLAVGGAPVYERLLVPILAEPDPEQPGLLAVAALAALASSRYGDLEPALGHDEPRVRAAVVNACSLSGGAPLDSWIVGRFRDATKNEERASLLHVIGRRGVEPPDLIQWLQGDDVAVVRAAVEAARGADARRHLPVLEYLLDHEDTTVREQALVVALSWGSYRSTMACERWALDTDVPRPLPMALYAALGSPDRHERLARKLPLQAHRRSTIFALGFSGNPAAVSWLVDSLTDRDVVTAKIAAQALSMVTGLDLRDDRFASKSPPDASEDPALPPLETDDLEADLAPAPEDALSVPNAPEIKRFCAAKAAAFVPGRRYLGGREVQGEVVLDYLEEAPLRQRHVLSLAESIGRRGTVWIDTRRFARDQRHAIAAARAAGRRAR